MWIMAIRTIVPLIVCVLELLSSSAALEVSPHRATRSIGDTVRLNCSDPIRDSLHWSHVPLDSQMRTYIYNSGIGIQLKYELGGRHSVEVDDSSGSCDLLIKRLSVEDAGTYICRRDDGEYLETELIILVSEPTCESNPIFDDVLVDNDCDLEPDCIELTCRSGYHGNIPPVLEWRHSSDPDVIVSGAISQQSTTSNKIVVINSRTRASNIRMNGTHFVCSVDEVESGEQSYGCATREVSVVYLFNSTERRSIDISHDDQGVNISCFANTSQPCHYRWRVTSTSTKNPIEILGQTIDLLKQDFRDMRCLAECKIRNVLCTVEPLLVEFKRIETGSWRQLELPFFPTMLVNCIVLIVIVLVILFIWKSKHVSNVVKKWRHSFSSKRKLGGSLEEMQPLHDMGSFDIDLIRDQVRMLVKYLQPGQFIDRLMSSGVLTGEENNMLPQEHQDEGELIEFVTSIVNKRTKLNFLLAMVIECDPNFHCTNSKIADFITKNMSKLIECLDVGNGLAECLFSKQVLTSEEYEKLSNKTRWDSYQEQNRELLSHMLLPKLNSISACKLLLAALLETDQRHIFNFISNSSHDVQFTRDDHCRILTADELNKIDRNLFDLVNLIDPSPILLDSLLRESCIGQHHRDRIDAQQTMRDKNKELLTIIRRRSYGDFKTFERVIRKTQKNRMIVKLLEQESGHVISAHCEINIESDALMSLENLTELETKISSHLTDPTILSQSLTHTVASRLNGLHEVGIDMIGATPTGSVIVYFSCQTFQSIVAFKQMVVNGELIRIMEELFNRILGFSALFRFNIINRILGLSALFRVRLIVSLSETEYRSCIEEARRTIYTETKSTKQQLESECYIRHLPRELLDLILSKSIVGIMSVEWRSNATDIKSISSSYNLYEILSNKIWISAYITLKSVTYQWRHVRYLGRGVALKQFVLRRLCEHSTIFTEQLNCRYVLLDYLEKEGIITDEERRGIVEAGDGVATETYEEIPDFCWPQMRDSEQMLMSNKKLLKCLVEKNYSQISKFLRIMDDVCLTHILNHFINSEGSQCFGDVRPLSYALRSNVIKYGTAILTRMNILDLPEKIETIGEEFGKEVRRCPSNSEEEIEFSNDFRDQEKNLSKSSDDNILGEPQPDRQNLIQLLYNEGCISLLHQQLIEQQPSQRLQNLVMLQLIKNGSTRTFKVSLEYFRVTNQFDVCNMLSQKYKGEYIQSPDWIEGATMESPIAVCWLEDRIYVISHESNRVQVFQDVLEIEHIELKGMQKPIDMTASKLSRSVFISDFGSRCIWTINMPGKMINKWGVDGEPHNMSVSSSDVLIVCVLYRYFFHLNLYRSSDMKRMKQIFLLAEIIDLIHAVQLLNRHFVISYRNDRNSFLISELSSDGRIIIRSFNPPWCELIMNERYDWMPQYISMDEDENIFIADNYRIGRVALLNSSWTGVRILLTNDQHEIDSPRKVCYVRDKDQLIVSQGRLSSGETTQGVCIFNLHSHTPRTTDHRIVERELDLIKSSLFETVPMNMMNMNMNKEWNPVHNMPGKQLIKRFEVPEETSEVVGVTWLGNKIYVVCQYSNIVHVFPDQEPFSVLDEDKIIIRGMKNPWDISASKVRQTIFISEYFNRCIWKFHIYGKKTSRWETDGRPKTLSITPSDELLVVVDRGDHYELIIFRCLDVNESQSIPLPFDVDNIADAVQSTNGNIFMSYSTRDSPGVFLISELSSNGWNLIRTFDPRLVKSINVKNWLPGHLLFSEDGNLFIADFRHQRVYLLNSELTDPNFFLSTSKFTDDFALFPRYPRFCYVQEKQMLIAGQKNAVLMLYLLKPHSTI